MIAVMTTMTDFFVKISVFNQVLQHSSISIDSEFNEALSSFIVCLTFEKTRSNFANMLKIENTFMIMRVSKKKRFR